MRSLKKLNLVLSCLLSGVPFFALATTYFPLDGSPFPEVDKGGPVTITKNYTLTLPVTTHLIKTDLHLDTPQGALLAVMSKDETIEAQVKDKPLPVFNYRGLKELPTRGEVFHLSTLTAGTHKLRLERFKTSTEATLLISQPKSPLLLKAKVKPLAVPTNKKIEVLIELEDEKNIPFTEVSVVLQGRTYRARQTSNQKFVASFLAPPVKTIESIPIQVRASGMRFDKAPFKREEKIYVMVIRPQSGIKKVFTGEQADIGVEVLPANGHFRLNVIYGYKGKAIAFAEENFSLTKEGSTTHILIKRPSIALVSDKALVKLLNRDTLGLEGQRVIALSPDREALKTFQMALPTVPVLPENKAKAVELLEYTHTDDL